MKYTKKITHSERETRTLAQTFAKKLHGGELIFLFGDLGSGKTTFTKGIAKTLGITKIVKSPTFSLMNVYEVKKPKIKTLVHIDCYRLDTASELKEIGAYEYFFSPKTITFIEWPEKIEKTFSLKTKKIIRIYFEYTKNTNERILDISV